MADTTKTTKNLKVDCDFVDGDTRAFNIKNPKSSITANNITALNQYMQVKGVLIGDKTGSTFLRIAKASTITKTTVDLDIDGN